MTKQEIRLRCLELSIPQGLVHPCLETILKRADAYVRFVEETGTAALTQTKADVVEIVKASSLDTSKEPSKPRRQKQTA